MLKFVQRNESGAITGVIERPASPVEEAAIAAVETLTAKEGATVPVPSGGVMSVTILTEWLGSPPFVVKPRELAQEVEKRLRAD